jgi:hypothetical protein
MTGPDAGQAAVERPDTALLAAYAEVCRSYHAIDQYRMKLLGLLPLASLVAVFVLDPNAGADLSSHPAGADLIQFGSLFAAMLTLSPFLYELRGIRRCDSLIAEGRHLEVALGIGRGQFHVCVEEHAHPSRLLRALNAKFAACTIYSLVFAGWLFLALRVGFGVDARSCVMWAVGVGLAIALTTYALVRKLTPA